MNEQIKEFIEDHIDKIDNEEWDTLFESWYVECTFDSIADDDLLITEFFEVMRQAGIPQLKERSVKERTEVIKCHLDNVIQDRWGKYYSRIDTWNMYYSDIVTDLYSWLGFTREELYEILNNWDDAGLTPKPEINALEVEGM